MEQRYFFSCMKRVIMCKDSIKVALWSDLNAQIKSIQFAFITSDWNKHADIISAVKHLSL